MPRLENLTAHCLGQRLRSNGAFGRRTLRGRAQDESTAEHAGLAQRRIVEHAGLTRRYALLARNQFDFITAIRRAQATPAAAPGSIAPARNLKTLANRAIKLTVADQLTSPTRCDPSAMPRAAPPDAAAGGLQPHHIERCAGGDAQSAPLADGEVNDALMRPMTRPWRSTMSPGSTAFGRNRR